MKNYKIIKKLSIAISILTIAMGTVACNSKNVDGNQEDRIRTSKSYTFKVNTGDMIKVELNTKDKYNLTSDVPFDILQDDEVLSSGTFIPVSTYEEYADALKAEDLEDAKLIDSGEDENIEYYMWNYKDSEYNYVIKVKESNTGLILGNPISEKSAKECFERLVITREE